LDVSIAKIDLTEPAERVIMPRLSAKEDRHMKIVRVETLLSCGPFPMSNEWKKIRTISTVPSVLLIGRLEAASLRFIQRRESAEVKETALSPSRMS
jgi:hypothetical protein